MQNQSLLLAAIITFISATTIAQTALSGKDPKIKSEPIVRKNSISIHPMGSLVGISTGSPYKLRLTYERVLSKRVSIGVSVVSYPKYEEIYDTTTFEYRNSSLDLNAFSSGAFKVMPFTRIYFGNADTPQGFYFQGKIIAIHGFSENKNLLVSSFGGGCGAGYRVFMGKRKRFTADANLGINITTFPTAYGNLDRLGVLIVPAVWYTLGPGSLLDNGISIGYAF